MTLKDTIFICVMAYSFIAVAVLWSLDLRGHFGWFCVIVAAGMPLPFAIEKIWHTIGG